MGLTRYYGTILPCDYAKHMHGIAVEILSVSLSIRLSNACIVTKRKHIAKKFNDD